MGLPRAVAFTCYILQRDECASMRRRVEVGRGSFGRLCRFAVPTSSHFSPWLCLADQALPCTPCRAAARCGAGIRSVT